MSAKDDSNPIANTAMFRAFTSAQQEPAPTRHCVPVALAVLAALVVVAVIVVLVLVLR